MSELFPSMPSLFPDESPYANMNSAAETLGLSPQEIMLYRHHLANLLKGGIQNPDGSVSTALVMGTNIDGREYNLPTVWNNQVLSPLDSIRSAISTGLQNWPSYRTPQEADARYQAMHDWMARDADIRRR